MLTQAQVAEKVREIVERGFCILDRDTEATWEVAAGGQTGWVHTCHDAFMGVLRHFVAGTEPNRGPNRYYMNVPPAEPFLVPLEHPDILVVIEALLGEDFLLENLGSDTPLGVGATHQDYHRDTGNDPQGAEDIWSLIANVALTDVTAADGPFEIVPGTAQGEIPDCLPVWPEKPVPVLMKAGDVMIRDPRAVHRGSPSHSPSARPALAYIFVRAGRLNSWGLGRATPFAHDVVDRLSERGQRLLEGSPRVDRPTPYVGYNSGEESIFESAARLSESAARL